MNLHNQTVPRPQSTEFVPKYYEMDPDTEDVIPSKYLREGMMVLIEGSLFRNDPEAISDTMRDYDISRLREMNRFCEVTHLEFDRGHRVFSFVGVYQDGLKKYRTLGISHGWIVKKESVPRCSNPECMDAGYCPLDNRLVRECITRF